MTPVRIRNPSSQSLATVSGAARRRGGGDGGAISTGGFQPLDNSVDFCVKSTGNPGFSWIFRHQLVKIILQLANLNSMIIVFFGGNQEFATQGFVSVCRQGGPELITSSWKVSLEKWLHQLLQRCWYDAYQYPID